MENRKICSAPADIELVRTLSMGFGPSGCEDEIRMLIENELKGLPLDVYTDRMGNLIVKMSFGKTDARPVRLMVSAHMDEVGFMVTDITEEGYLRFDTVGGIHESVLAGRKVTFGDEINRVRGVICSKAVHHKTKEERTKATPIEKLYVDIGTSSREESEKYLAVGSFGTFDSEFVRFGQNERMLKSKALDDRMGCAAMIEVIRSLLRENPSVAMEVYFCFTVREEIGLSGAKTAAHAIAPDFALVLETTAVGDIADAKPAERVADVGKGGAISLMDRSTIYDRAFVSFLLQTAKDSGIAAQVKRYVSGGNDAGSIHKTREGVRTAALSVPTRYLHSPACVASLDDYEALRDLTEAAIRNFDKLLSEESV